MNDPILHPVQPKTRSVFKVIAGVIVFFIVSGLVGGLFASNGATPEAVANTQRNSFISSCKVSAGGDEYASACGCAYDKLQVKYGGGFTNQYDRIKQSGYTSEETDLIATCANG